MPCRTKYEENLLQQISFLSLRPLAVALVEQMPGWFHHYISVAQRTMSSGKFAAGRFELGRGLVVGEV